MAKAVAELTEKRLRAAFVKLGGTDVASATLAQHLVHSSERPMTRAAAYMAISNATACGLLLRTGHARHFSYRINATWKRPELRAKRAHAGDTRPRAVATSLAYSGPAFDTRSLAPALGPRPADPEVMPPEIADMVASLHQRFFRHGHGVVEAE